MKVRPLTLADLPQVMAIQDECYPDVGHDSVEIFADKLRVYPTGCFAVVVEGRVGGYLFSHPWTYLRAATLDRPLVLPPNPDCYYLHDLAVAPWCRGRGAAQAMVEAGLLESGPLEIQALVAVHSTQPFWSGFGFRDLADPPVALRLKLLDYSPDASYMVRGFPEA
jgi:ribosomal protein S18 acetylase RimI-like enzyme